MTQLTNREILKLQKEVGYFQSKNIFKHLSLSPTAMKKLSVRVARKGIHEARKVKKVASLIDSAKSNYYMKKPALKGKVEFKEHAEYEVSIVIPVYNKLAYTQSCLASICTTVSSHIKYQVIVIDNASADITQATLTKIKGLKYVRNNENLGFVGACNQGAKLAESKYIVFLNNDTAVQNGWLEGLLETVKKEGVGVVGSQLIYPNKKLQEAGGIIFKDASGNNYGRGDWPWMYQYNYTRSVDYCSGASIIIAKQLFDRLGGFDNLYAPAYYEDTDLAFSARKAGYQVLYQPKSKVYHIEGGTAGTDVNSGFKKYQTINHAKFKKKWHKELQSQYTSDDVYLARDKSATKLALIVDENLPRPDEDSGSVRMSYIVDIFRELGYKVTFFPYNTTLFPEYAEVLQQKGVEVVYGNVNFNNFIKQYGKYYDVVMLSRPRIATFFIDECKKFCEKAKIIYDTVDLHYLRYQRQSQFEKNPDHWMTLAKKHEILEKYCIERADMTFVVSNQEKVNLDNEGLKNIEILSNIHRVDEEAYRNGYSDRRDLVFVGGFAHPPNEDGIRWFVDQIFPSVRKEIDDIKLHVVGSHMSEDLRKDLSAVSGVIVDGYVEDLSGILNTSRIFVAPLRYGAGVKGKIGQAIEHGIPVVSTNIGVEGMHLKNDQSCLVADEDQAFAEAVIKLYQDKQLWDKVQTSAKKILIENFSPEKTTIDLRKYLNTK